MNPDTAYILHWFPKPSETFIFREVETIRQMGLPVRVFTLFGEISEHLSLDMAAWPGHVERGGFKKIGTLLSDLGYWRAKKPGLAADFIGRLVKQIPRDIEKWSENWWAGLTAFHLARRFIETGIRHVHAPWASGPATAAWMASRLTGIPFSFTARAHDIHPPDQLLTHKIKAAAFIRCPTRYNRDYLTSINPASASKMHVIYNGLTLQGGSRANAPEKVPIRLLAVGRLVEKKGFVHLVRACRILKEDRIDFHLVLAGDGPLKGELARLVRQWGLREQVSFPGFVTFDDIPGFFDRAHMLVMPSVVDSSGDRDGIPNVIVEALMHGLPVVASNVSGIPEVIQDGRTGLLVPPGHPHALATAILELARDRKKADVMAEEGRDRVVRQFDPERNYSQIIALFREHALA